MKTPTTPPRRRYVGHERIREKGIDGAFPRRSRKRGRQKRPEGGKNERGDAARGTRDSTRRGGRRTQGRRDYGQKADLINRRGQPADRR